MTTAAPPEPSCRRPVSSAPTPLAELPGGTRATEVSSAVLSENLLRGQKSVAIQHNGLVYRLQATKLGKLILTK
jgi:hemin uptake protein HemP